MASRTLTVVAKVKDASSAALKKVKQGFDDTGKSVKNTGINLTEFNRIMFSTTAFIGLFTRQFSMMSNALAQAGDLERLQNQFQRVVGPKGELFQAINGMTKNTIDRMEAMRAGIALRSTGVVKDVRSIAEVVSRAGTAAKRAGLNSAEGIKRVVDFMKDGSVSSLSFLNVLTPTNSALQAQMAVLQRAGGIFGNVISTQAKLRMGMAALRAATQGMENDTRDLSDTLQSMSQSFTFLRGEAGMFLGKALTPILDKVIEATDAVTDFIERVKNTDQTLLNTVKNIIIVTGAFATLLATVGSARLLFRALGALGIGGIPFLAMSLLGLASAFTDTEKAIEPFIRVLKSAGAVMLGVFQLMSSFLGDSDNFAKGIGKMDSELMKFLQKQGLLELTKDLARVGAIIVKFVQDTGNQLITWIKELGEMLSPLAKMFKDFFGDSDPKGWSRKWLDGGGGMRDMLVKITAATLGLYGAFKLLSFGKGLLSKIPIIGKFFGGKGGGLFGGPDGSQRDPLYVVMTRGAASFFGIDKLLNIARNPATVATTGGIAGTVAGAAGTAVAGVEGVATTAATAGMAGGMAGTLLALAKFTAAITVAAAAGYALGKAIMYIDDLLGGKLGLAIEKAIDSVAGFFRIPGSSAMQKEQEALMNTKEYQAVVAMLQKAGKPATVDSATALTKTVIANANVIAKQKQLEMNQAGIFGKTAAAIGMLDISPEAQEFGSKEAIERMSQSAIFTRPGDVVGAFATTMPEAQKRSEFLMSSRDEKGDVIAPAMPTTEVGQQQVLADLMSGLEANAKAKVQMAINEAMMGTSAAGKEITAEEWQKIFTSAMDKSQVTQHTKTAATKPEKTEMARTQRC